MTVALTLDFMYRRRINAQPYGWTSWFQPCTKNLVHIKHAIRTRLTKTRQMLQRWGLIKSYTCDCQNAYVKYVLFGAIKVVHPNK